MRRVAQGFLSHNRIGQLKHDAEAWMTFEGDNYVLLQQVGIVCCSCYGKRCATLSGEGCDVW